MFQVAIAALQAYILSTAGSEHAAIAAALSDKKNCALLLHEQQQNLPIQLKPKLHEALRTAAEFASSKQVSI